ncbi:MAG: 50S ribosomal protein L17 [Candidatus Omnitrophica bacterium]|nr:50S ribosomal protein L17 [Candidatus Omnitrophota bacterium]
MRHACAGNRLSRTSEHRRATLSNMARNVLQHGQIRTTVAKAKEAQRLIDRLVGLGKEGSVHSRRQAYRVLKDRGLVKQLFADVSPRFLDCQGGYTRVLKLGHRLGDGAATAVLELTRLPAGPPKAPPKPKAKAEAAPAQKSAAPQAPKPKAEEAPAKPKRFFEGIRELFGKKKAGADS